MAQKKTTSAKAKTAKVKSSATQAKGATVAAKSKAATKSKTAASARGTSSKTRVASKAAPVKAKAASKTVKAPAAKAAPAKVKTAAAKAKSAATKTSAVKKPAAAKPAVAKTAKAKTPATKAAAKPAAKATAKPTASKAKPTASAAKPVAAKTVKPAKASKAKAAKSAPAVAAPPASPAVVATGAAARAVAASIAEAAARKISSPIKPLKTPKGIAEKAAANRDSALSKKPVSQRHGFKTNEHVVYPAHGVGKIIGIEEQEIAGMALELFVIHFEKEKLTLRVPTGKLESVGLRKLAEGNIVDKSLDVLKGRARVKRTMWSRRAQEYVAKINSGDLIAIAEVVRDLYRSEAQPEQSYSERQLYEDALDRMAREVAAVYKLDERGAIQRITDVLAKSARTRRAADDAGDEGADDDSATQAA